MLEYIINLIKSLRKKTVASVMSSFMVVANELKEVEAAHQLKAEQNAEVIAKATEAQAAAVKESTLAKEVQVRLDALINPTGA